MACTAATRMPEPPPDIESHGERLSPTSIGGWEALAFWGFGGVGH